MDNNILYIGLALDDTSKAKLLKFGEEIASRIDGFEPKWFCHHMTMAFKNNLAENIMAFVGENEGRKFKMAVSHIGVSEKAIAARVLTKVPSTNNIKHVTIATNIETNGKPFDSNNITNWKRVPLFELEGIVTIFRK